jgi:hypothetical protein
LRQAEEERSARMANILRAAFVSVVWDATEYEQGAAGVKERAVVPERRLDDPDDVVWWLEQVYSLEVESWRDTGERLVLRIPAKGWARDFSDWMDPHSGDSRQAAAIRKAMDHPEQYAVTVGRFGRLKPDPRFAR